jgi:hypothetical protein
MLTPREALYPMGLLPFGDSSRPLVATLPEEAQDASYFADDARRDNLSASSI